MQQLFYFLLKSSLCSAFLFIYYLAALKNKKMNGFNRWYLLGSVVFSLIIPLLDINVVQINAESARSFPILNIMREGSLEDNVIDTTSRSIDWSLLAMCTYALVSLCLLTALAGRVIWIYRMRNRNETIRMNGYMLVNTSLSSAPFSFGNILFWKDDITLESEEGKKVLMHELAHIRQHHTADKVFMQVLLAAFWLNPTLWLIRKELWLQHEFIADDCAIQEGDTESFATMLLHAHPVSQSSVANSFFHSPIKRRLMMISKSKQITHAHMRRFLAVPMLCLTVFMFSFTVKEHTANTVRAKKKMIIVLDAAHGGKDDGGKGLDGIKEKDISLKICRKIMALSSEYNIVIVPTREADVYPTLQERLDMSNSVNADLFLSIHLNKSTPEDPRGNEYELGVSKRGANYEQSLKLASAIAPRLESADIQASIVDQSKIFVIRENKHTALLLECGNIDDAANLERLADDKRLEILCRNILSGIVDYGAANN